MYSLDFATEVSRICMDEIRRRGLYERKILRKSVPNSVLLLKVFRKQNCTADDLTHVSIHSVATLMQDTLWCCQERIVPKKVWRVINYETCTLDDLSQYISKRGENLLWEILDFLVEVMKYKNDNQMDAYHLGEAMGKVTLGPADCDPIIAEKAGHFMTRMIIEHSKMMHERKRLLFKVDSGLATQWHNHRPMSKTEAARAKTKSYNRIIKKIRKRNEDWISIVHVALYAMLENEYEQPPSNQYGEPYLSIFSKHLDPSQAMTSPVLFRLVTEASKAIEPIPLDPFSASYLFNNRKRKTQAIEKQISVAFDDFKPLLQNSSAVYYGVANATNFEKPSIPHHKSHKNIINSSFSNMKLNLKKHKSQGMSLPVDIIEEQQQQQDGLTINTSLLPRSLPPASARTDSTESYTTKTLYSSEDFSKSKHHPMKNMMKKVIKIVPTKKVSQTSIY